MIQEDDTLTWEAYRELVYGFLDEEEKKEDNDLEDEQISYRQVANFVFYQFLGGILTLMEKITVGEFRKRRKLSKCNHR